MRGKSKVIPQRLSHLLGEVRKTTSITSGPLEHITRTKIITNLG